MDQNDYRCCGGQNFRFDGQHIICNKCGGVLIQETKSQEQIEKEQVAAKKKHMEEKKKRQEEERKRYTLQGHYDSMMGFDMYLSESTMSFENDEVKAFGAGVTFRNDELVESVELSEYTKRYLREERRYRDMMISSIGGH